MFQWEVSAKAISKAKEKQIWNLWVDVENWPKWDHELEWCTLDGLFQKGTKGKLKPKGWPATAFEISLCEEGKSYADETKLPFTSLVFTHTVFPIERNQVEIIHHVKAKGLLAPLLWLTLGRKLKKNLPKAVLTLASLAEKEGES